MTEQLWPGLLAEAWAALAAAGGGAAPDSPDGPLPPGIDPRLPAGLEVLWVSGTPGHLTSRLPVEDTAIACTAAALLAAAALHAQRGGDCGSRGSPTARLDLGQVAAAFRSEAYLRINGEPGRAGLRAAVAILARGRRLGAHARKLPLASRGTAAGTRLLR